VTKFARSLYDTLLPEWAHPRRLSRTRRSEVGARPGTLNVDPDAHPSHCHVLVFHQGELVVDEELTDMSRLEDLRAQGTLWLNINGLGSKEVLDAVATTFGIHALAMEDVVNTGQGAKLETYDTGLFFVMNQASTRSDTVTSQTAIYFGAGFVVSFHEEADDSLDPLRQRLRAGQGRIRAAGSDYLAYCIIDTLIDCFFPVVDHLGQRLEELELEVMAGAGPRASERIYGIKRNLTSLRRAIFPLRDALGQAIRTETDYIEDDTIPYLRDCSDHCDQIMEFIEFSRETATSLVDLYLSMASQRMNEIMKVLTIMSSVFIPLSFIVGFYGMNVAMPEYSWPHAREAIVVGMLGLSSILLAIFWWRGWIGWRGPR